MAGEIENVQDLDHPNLIQLVDYKEDSFIKKSNSIKQKKVSFIVQEYAEKGSLFNFISHAGALGEDHARFYFKQMLDALDYLHVEGVAHRDLKPENVLLDYDFNLKIGDFGLSTETGTHTTYCGTVPYMPPEMLKGMHYEAEHYDLWACGVMLFIMITGFPPFREAADYDPKYCHFESGDTDYFWDSFSSDLFFSEDLRDLLNWMFKPEPDERPTLSEILDHDFMLGPMPGVEEIFDEFNDRITYMSEVSVNKDSTPPDSSAYDEQASTSNTSRGVDSEGNEGPISRTAKEYKKSPFNVNEFMSNEDAEDLFTVLVTYIQQKAVQYELSDKNYKAKFSVKESFDGKDGHKFEEVLHIKVKVVVFAPGKDGKEAVHCVQFEKESGDFLLFNEFYREAREFFGSYANVETEKQLGKK